MNQSFSIRLAIVTMLLLAPGSSILPASALTQAPAVRLAAAVAEAPPSDQARGVFLERTTVVQIRAPRVILASTPDGRGELCTDDEVYLSLHAPDHDQQQWQYLFADADQRAIVCLPPQRLEVRAGPGEYTVRLTLYDRFPFTYSSRPYYLVGATPADNVVTILPTAAEQASPTVAPVPVPSAVAAAPTGSLIQPSVTAVNALPTGVPASADVGAPQPLPLPLPMLALLLTLLLLGAILLALLLRQRHSASQPPRLSGILDVTDCASGESRTVLLQRFPCGAMIVRAPLRVIALNPDAPPSSALAVLEAGVQGPQVRIDGPDVADIITLHRNEAIRIDGQIELRYRT